MRRLAGVGALLFVAGFLLWSFAGDLEPPGPPGPTMKTLDEVEPRIPIFAADLQLLIDTPGSYYLAEPPAGGGIFITVSNVTIDLMGYCLCGGPGDGIASTAAADNLTIRNGVVAGFTTSGISFAVGSTHNLIVGVRAEGNGGIGIEAGSHSIVRDSVARNNTGDGIVGGTSFLIFESISTGNGGDGIRGQTGSIVKDCLVASNTGDGIEISARGLIVNNNSHLNGDAGILVTALGNRIEGNNLTGNEFGIRVDAAGNVIVKNSASGNTGLGFPSANYHFTVTGNDIGPIGSAATSTSPWANIEY